VAQNRLLLRFHPYAYINHARTTGI